MGKSQVQCVIQHAKQDESFSRHIQAIQSVAKWQFSVYYQLDSRLENLTPVIIHRLGEEGVWGFCLCYNKIYPLISHKAL